MRTNETVQADRREAQAALWQFLSESPIFKTIFRIEAQSGLLKIALDVDQPTAPNRLHLQSVAEIIEQEATEFTDLLTDWLLDRGVTVEKLTA